MSLKAKIEAVIYAAEEPVTLAQIAALFQEELIEERAARLSAEAAALEEAREEVVSEADAVTQPLLGATDGEPEETGDGEASIAEAATAEGETPTEPSPEDEKRAARQKERELREEARRVVGQLVTEYGEGDRGIEIREIAGGYRLAGEPGGHDGGG